MTLGKRLKNAREERKLSQGELGKLTKIHPQHISRYENNRAIPSSDKLGTIAMALQVSTDYLIFDGQRKEDVEFNNPILKESFVAVGKLNKKDQEAIIRLINAMILKNHMSGVMGSYLDEDELIEKIKRK